MRQIKKNVFKGFFFTKASRFTVLALYYQAEKQTFLKELND